MDNKLIYYWVNSEMFNELYRFKKTYKTKIEKGEFPDADNIFKCAATLRYYVLNNESIEGLESLMAVDSDSFYLEDIAPSVYGFLNNVMLGKIRREYLVEPFIRYSIKLLMESIYNKMENQEEKSK